ncbi:MAG: hypothetical protein ABSF26_30745 [Thermoguttaceae bacterium]|jgi:hypothetical protein
MGNILFDEYQMNSTTWVCLSSLIMIAVYFKFRRFWSVRNVDLIGLICFAPGLLLVSHGLLPRGYVWLFSVGSFFLVRLLLDPTMVRRPLLEPNLSASGLTFAGAAMLVFLIYNVVTPRPTKSDVEGAQWMDMLLARHESPEIQTYLHEHGPGYPLFFIFSTFSSKTAPGEQTDDVQYNRALTRSVFTRAAAILAHLAVVLGMVLIGYRHFDNVHTGVAAATLYLLLPYTADYTPRVDHVVPAALLVWAVESYRRPAIAGTLLGLAAGVIYYPLYLLPLWCSFYWRRGLVRFGLGVLLVLALLVGSLAFTASSLGSFAAQLRQMFGFMSEMVYPTNLTGFWAAHQAVFLLPVFAAFVALCASMALWPAQKNLGTLLGCSAAIMLAAQFVKGYEGGIYMAWYLPLLILTIFRPNLEDRVALSAISEGWTRRRKQ